MPKKKYETIKNESILKMQFFSQVLEVLDLLLTTFC